MITTRKVRIASVVAGLLLSLFVAAPAAHADDDLGNLRARVNGDRARSTCTPLKYNQTLQDIGFAQGQFIPLPQNQINGMIAAYGGEVRSFIGVGDPIAAATNDAFNKGAGGAIADCHWTEFGVSFTRYETTETDWVGLIFGRPATVTPPVGPGVPGGTGAPPVQCGPDDETPTVPAGQQCKPKPKPPVQCPPGGPQKEVPAGQTCPAPTNAVRVNIQRQQFAVFWPVTVTNSAGIGGSCTYVATDTGGGFGHTENFDIGPNGQANFSVPAPVISRTYKVVTSCTGTYDGKQVEFGHDEQTISL